MYKDKYGEIILIDEVEDDEEDDEENKEKNKKINFI